MGRDGRDPAPRGFDAREPSRSTGSSVSRSRRSHAEARRDSRGRRRTRVIRRPTSAGAGEPRVSAERGITDPVPATISGRNQQLFADRAPADTSAPGERRVRPQLLAADDSRAAAWRSRARHHAVPRPALVPIQHETLAREFTGVRSLVSRPVPGPTWPKPSFALHAGTAKRLPSSRRETRVSSCRSSGPRRYEHRRRSSENLTDRGLTWDRVLRYD